MKKLLALLLVLAALSGCATRTIYVPHGQPVRLREKLEGVKIWAFDKDGVLVEGEMDIPEGWYCVPDLNPEKKPE